MTPEQEQAHWNLCGLVCMQDYIELIEEYKSDKGWSDWEEIMSWFQQRVADTHGKECDWRWASDEIEDLSVEVYNIRTNDIVATYREADQLIRRAS